MSLRLDIRLHPAAALLLVVLLSTHANAESDIDLTTRVTIGSRTGLFPGFYTSDEDADVIRQEGIVSSQANVSPGVQFAWVTRRVRFSADYLLSLSNSIGREGRYALDMFQQAGLNLSSLLTRTLTFNSSASAGMGILDYSSALYRFDTGGDIAANLPQEDEIRFVNVNASVGIAKQFTRRSSGGGTLTYRTSVPLGNQDITERPFSLQHQSMLQLNLNSRLSRRDSVELMTSGGLVLNSPGLDVIPISLSTGLVHLLSQEGRIRLSVGFTTAYQKDIDNSPLLEEDDGTPQEETLTYLIPQGRISYQDRLFLPNRQTLTTSLDGSLNAYFDRVTATIRQQGLVGISASWIVSPEWRLNARVSFSTLITPNPRQSDLEIEVAGTDYPTAATFDVGAGYTLRRVMELRFGVSSSARWAHIWESDSRVRAFEELVFYVTVLSNKNHFE